MNENQWNAFCNFREEFKTQCKIWSEECPSLKELQKQAAQIAKTPDYSFEIPVVYNTDLDRITTNDDIRLIVIGDNPGKDEQLLKNQKYLVGQAGKIAEGYFRRNSELQIDFRKNVIILNKTPIHSAKTNQLKTIAKLGGEQIQNLINETQIWMAKKTAELQQKINAELWLVGYSELKEKKLFTLYRDNLKAAYQNEQEEWNKVYVFQHFSMNRFSIDLADFISAEENKQKSLQSNIHRLGVIHKTEIFG